MNRCTYAYMYVCKFVGMLVCIFVCMYIYVCMCFSQVWRSFFARCFITIQGQLNAESRDLLYVWHAWQNNEYLGTKRSLNGQFVGQSRRLEQIDG